VTFLRSLNKRLLFVQIGILLTFMFIPVWFRLPQSPFLSPLYVTRFLVLLPAIFTIGIWLLMGLPGLRAFLGDRRRSIWGLCLLLLALWAFSSQSWAFIRLRNPQVAATSSLQFGVAVLFVIVVACARPPLRVMTAALMLGVLWNALITYVQTANQGAVGLGILGEFPMSPNSVGASVVVAGDLRWLRPYSLLPHPNILGGFFVVGLLALIGWMTAPQKFFRWLGTGIFLLGLWALLLTFSRGAWLGFAAALFALYPIIRRHLKGVWRHVFISGALIVIVGIAFAIVYRPLLSARAGEGAEGVELRSVSDRAVYTHFSMRAVSENFQLGVGSGNFPWRASYYLSRTNFDLRGDNVHHVMLSAFAELGVVGFVLLTGALIFGVEAALNSIRRAPDARERACFLAAFLAFVIIGLLDHYPWTMLQMQLAWWGMLAAALGVGAKTATPTQEVDL
jgi:O-antigen ligase